MGVSAETRRVRIQRAESPTQRRIAAARPSVADIALESSADAAAAALETLELDEPPRRRADTRASTEPVARFAQGTSSRAPSPSLDLQGTSSPSLDLQGTWSRASSPSFDLQGTSSRASSPSLDIQGTSSRESSPTFDVRGTSPTFDIRGTSSRASSPSLDIQIAPWHAAEHASFQPSRESWLGVAVAPPQVGARIVVGTRTGAEFIVTSPATEIIERDDGVLVVTETNNLYFVAGSGDAHLVRRH